MAAFFNMSTNESLGDSVTHFYKTGGVLRHRDVELLRLRNILPVQGPASTRVEYDIWYDMNDAQRVHGYVYTDALGQFIYLRVGDASRSHELMAQAARSSVTEEGRTIVRELATATRDKYRLRKTDQRFERVAFLAGANILEKAVDWSKLDELARDGWKLKCHPLTSRDLKQLLVNRFGAEAIIDKGLSGYALLEGAKEVACAENSEMGIAAVAKGKRLVSIGCGNRQLTYSAIYAQLFPSQDKLDTLCRIMSYKASGLIPTCVPDPAERVSSFFDQYKDIPHVPPKKRSY